ncbi:hypothetical protein [Yoonia sp.]|uniref:hypothetical protein n=1 Tax=Yoonia sp. TaxID=2212373 RepID=UPI003976F441
MPIKTTAIAAVLALTATTAFAGGLSPAITETPLVEDEIVAATPSIDPAYIVVGVVAALLIAASVGNDNSDTLTPIALNEEPESTSDNRVVRISGRVSQVITE